MRCCEKSLALAPTSEAAEILANLYLNEGDLAKWEETLLACLQNADLDKDRQQLHGLLAREFAARGLWRRALPHAEEYGRGGSQSGLSVASQVTEALAQWQESEQWMRRLSENYAVAGASDWYFWCARDRPW